MSSVKAYISDFAKRILREAEENEVIKQDVKKVVQAVIDSLKGTENDSQILSQINKALLDYASTNPDVSLDLAKKIFADMAMSGEWDELAVEEEQEEDELLEEQEDEYPEWLVRDLHKVIRNRFGEVEDMSDTVAVSLALADTLARARGIIQVLEDKPNEAEFMDFVKSQIAELLSPEAKPMSEFRTKGKLKKKLKKKNESTEATSAGSDKLPESIKREIESEIIGVIEGLKDEGIEVIYSKIAEWLNEWLRDNDYSRAPVVELIDALLDEYGLNDEYEKNGAEEPKQNGGTNESAIYRVYHKSASYFAE